MPQQYIKYTNPELDGRVKVTPEIKQQIKDHYEKSQSQRATARYFQIDKGTVKAVIDPIWYKEKQQKRYKKKPWLDNYDRQEHKMAMRKTRAKKRLLNHVYSEEKICRNPECKKQFTAKTRGKVYCTSKCAEKHYNKFKRNN